MSDITGGRTHEMDAKATQFIHQAEEFKTSVAHINSAVQALMEDWWGNSPIAYQHAMGKWQTDVKAVIADLEEISNGLKGSSSALTQLDQDLAGLFKGLGG